MLGGEQAYWRAMMNQTRQQEAQAAAARVREKQQRQDAFDQVLVELEKAEADFKVFNRDWDQPGRAAAVTHHYLKGHMEMAKILVKKLKRIYTGTSTEGVYSSGI